MTRDFAAEPDFAAATTATRPRARRLGRPGGLGEGPERDGVGDPAADVGAMMLAELVLHGWDLAHATCYTVSDRAAAAALAAVEANAEMFPAVQGVRRAGFPAGRRGGARPRARAVRARPQRPPVPVVPVARG